MKQEKTHFSYEALWKYIIRPPRDNYSEDLLGPTTFIYRGKVYQRKDYDILSSMGYTMKCSLIEPQQAYRPSEEMPLILYLHGNSSSRLEGMRMTEEILKKDINLFLIDFPGCGLSGGEYISLGYHEKDDVGVVIDFLETLPGVGNIGIWGRSMGAATTILYAHKDPRVKAICVDSPFADFRRLAKEITLNHVNLPKFILDTILKFIRKTIKKKNGLDINLLKPIEAAKKTFQPVLFIHANNDELIGYQHSGDLYEIYKGPKTIRYLEKGGHNSRRPNQIIKKIGEFFKKYLYIDYLNLPKDKDENKEKNKEKDNNKINNNEEDDKDDDELENIKNNINDFSNDKYFTNIEQNEKIRLEQLKSCLLNIDPSKIKEDDI
jgi:dipeptidyl aminopeptidase/acylaminoacyl peptidase